MNRLLFLPSHKRHVNDAVLELCRKRGLEVYLWYKVLIDNDIMPEHRDQIEDAWGHRGAGSSGLWPQILDVDENFLFACPRNSHYNRLPLTRCEQILGMYDGLFLDCVGFPLPSLGLEAMFSCFCPYCLKHEPRLKEWRGKVLEAREAILSATDDGLEKRGGYHAVIEHYGLEGFIDTRYASVTALAAQYAALAKKLEKPMGLDCVTPALSFMSGHDYAELGKLADWIKPRVYSRIYGPSSLPLEAFCLARGTAAWGKRLTFPAILRYVERSTGITMPENVLSLRDNFVPDEFIFSEIDRAENTARCPIHPGLEFSNHPEYTSHVTAASVKTCVAAAAGSPGMVMAWNLMYIPEEYFRIIGKMHNA